MIDYKYIKLLTYFTLSETVLSNILKKLIISNDSL